MSPAVAAVLHLVDGRDVFVKVLPRGVNTVSETLVEREWPALAPLPATVPYARRVTFTDLGGWLLAAQVCLDALVDGSPSARRRAVETIRAGGEPSRRHAVGLVGMLTRASTNPPSTNPPHLGLPTFRPWQRRPAEALRPVLDELVT